MFSNIDFVLPFKRSPRCAKNSQYIHSSIIAIIRSPSSPLLCYSFFFAIWKSPHWISYFTTSTKQCSSWRLIKNNKNGESYHQVQGLPTLVLLVSTSPKRCWIKFESQKIDPLVSQFKPKNLPTLVFTILVNHKGSNLWLWNPLRLCLTATKWGNKNRIVCSWQKVKYITNAPSMCTL